MPMTIDPFSTAVPDGPAIRKLHIESATHRALDPGAFFEWHQQSRKLYVVRSPQPGRVTGDGTLIAEEIDLPQQAKMFVAAYVQGFAHGRGDKGVDRK